MDSEDWFAPFQDAVVLTLRELAGVESDGCETPAKNREPDRVAFSSVIRLTAEGEGYLVLNFPRETATALATRVLDGAAELNEEMIRDCAGELTNVVAGQAKTLLFGTPDHFTFSTPMVVNGIPELPSGEWRESRFTSELGDFALTVRRPR